MNWQVQEAKNKLSEVIERAQTEGPQTITRRGKQVAVVMSISQFKNAKKPKESLVEFFRKSPLVGQLDLERDRDTRCQDIDL